MGREKKTTRRFQTCAKVCVPVQCRLGERTTSLCCSSLRVAFCLLVTLRRCCRLSHLLSHSTDVMAVVEYPSSTLSLCVVAAAVESLASDFFPHVTSSQSNLPLRLFFFFFLFFPVCFIGFECYPSFLLICLTNV